MQAELFSSSLLQPGDTQPRIYELAVSPDGQALAWLLMASVQLMARRILELTLKKSQIVMKWDLSRKLSPCPFR